MTLVKIAGAVKIVLMANRFGASDELDAFLVAFSLPAFVGEVAVGVLPPALVPALIEVRDTQSREAMRHLFASATFGVLWLLVCGGAVLAIASPLILSVIGSGFNEEKRLFAQRLFYSLLVLLPLGGLSVMWRAALIAEERFAISSIATGMTPLLSVAVLLFVRPGASVWSLVFATLAGIAIELALLGFTLARAGFPLIPRWSGWNSRMRRLAAQYVPLVAAAAIGGGNLFIDQAMAATLAPGSVSALNYGIKLAAVIAVIAGGALGTAVLPQFSKLAASGDWTGLRETFLSNARMVLLIGVPLCGMMTAVSGTLVQTVFQKNSFTPESLDLITATQRFSLLQIPLSALLLMSLRLVSAVNANALLLRVAIVNSIFIIAGDYLLMQLMGVPGIALASTLAMLLSLVLVMLGLHRLQATRERECR